MTDDIEPLIPRWRLTLHRDGFELRLARKEAIQELILNKKSLASSEAL